MEHQSCRDCQNCSCDTRIRKLEIAQARIEEKYSYIATTLGTLSKQINTLVSSKGNKWDKLVDGIMLAIASGLVGFMMSNLL